MATKPLDRGALAARPRRRCQGLSFTQQGPGRPNLGRQGALEPVTALPGNGLGQNRRLLTIIRSRTIARYWQH